jgi:Dual OB-containing domain
MRITVNHLTRMKAPYVCVAGVDVAGRSIRPVLEVGQLPRSLLTSQGGPFQLGAVVVIGDPQPRPVAPEMEDVVFKPSGSSAVGRLDIDEFCEVLGEVAAGSLRSVFGSVIVRKSETAAAVPQHQGTISLGVLRAAEAQLTVRKSFGKHEIRVHFIDPDLGALSIKTTDLRLWEEDQVTPAVSNIGRIESALDNCYLAVGLSRAFAVSSYRGRWHWLQINNIFPAKDPLWARE